LTSRKIIFKHSRAVGDALMFTSGIRDFKLLFPDIEVNADSNFGFLWDNNPYLTRSLKKGDEGVEFYKVGYPIINNANNANTHFTQAFLLDMVAMADLHEPLPLSLGEFCAAFGNGAVGDPDIKHPLVQKYRNLCQEFARQRPDIHMTDKEKQVNIIRDVYGYEKYWVVAPGGKRDCTTKIWDWRRLQKVIDYYEGQIKFVTIGRSDHLVEKLENVIDLTDKFNDDFRSIFSLVYNSDGCISGVSFLMHLAAGIPPKLIKGQNRSRKPCVAIYGGREPTTFTCYTNHQVLHTNGAFFCCDNGGCWQSRVTPILKDPDKNNRMCHSTVKSGGRTIPSCMDSIVSEDVIRAIGTYYSGDIYEPLKKGIIEAKSPIKQYEVVDTGEKEINILASLQSKGGGEQSALKIYKLLEDDGWKVNFYPWGNVHSNWQGNGLRRDVFWDYEKKTLSADGMVDKMKPGLPLLFYANDQIWDFVECGEEIVAKSSKIVVGINFANGTLPKCKWANESGKLKAVIFQNDEKKNEFYRDMIGFENTELLSMFGAIDLDRFLEILPASRGSNRDELVVLKHCTPDWRKYITEQSENTGERIHIWQKHVFKEKDIVFYNRLMKDTKNVRFEFMEAHPELVNAYPNNPRMVFHKWDSMDVRQFLSRGHLYLYRTSNKWRDQYPRGVAEALASGIPVITEPRDGTRDRVDNGNTGIHCIDYDMFVDAVKKLQRKEDMRKAMGQHAKDWARLNLDPKRWVTELNRLFLG